MLDSENTLEPFLSPFMGIEEQLRATIEPIVADEKLELVSLQLVRGKTRDQLRLSVDRPGAGVTPGKGVNMAELEHLNRLLGDLLDVEDEERKLFGERWDLEVGSPGVDRPLTKKSHFKDVIGQKIKARLKLEKKSLLGRLEAATDENFTVDGVTMRFVDVENAHVVYEFAPPAKPGKGSKPGAPLKGAKAKKASKASPPRPS